MHSGAVIAASVLLPVAHFLSNLSSINDVSIHAAFFVGHISFTRASVAETLTCDVIHDIVVPYIEIIGCEKKYFLYPLFCCLLPLFIS